MKTKRKQLIDERSAHITAVPGWNEKPVFIFLVLRCCRVLITPLQVCISAVKKQAQRPELATKVRGSATSTWRPAKICNYCFRILTSCMPRSATSTLSSYRSISSTCLSENQSRMPRRGRASKGSVRNQGDPNLETKKLGRTCCVLTWI